MLGVDHLDVVRHLDVGGRDRALAALLSAQLGYYGALDQGLLPTLRGIELCADDLVRRAVIQALICRYLGMGLSGSMMFISTGSVHFEALIPVSPELPVVIRMIIRNSATIQPAR